MGLVYLFALVVGLGILVMQVAMGGKGDGGHEAHADGHDVDGHADADHGDVDHAADHGGDVDHADHGGDVDHADHGGDGSSGVDKIAGDADGGVVALFLSTRFWIFNLLAFGMSGSLIHVFALAGALATFAIAAVAGVASGLFAVLAFRAVQRTSSTSSPNTGEAVGAVGRVLVGVGPKKQGKIRVELRGQTVDMLATTDDEAIARGELILVEDVDESVARVSRRPRELE